MKNGGWRSLMANSQMESIKHLGSSTTLKTSSQRTLLQFRVADGVACIQQNTTRIFITMPNQTSPWTKWKTDKVIPLLGLDVWEHAYYLKYQTAGWLSPLVECGKLGSGKRNFQQDLESNFTVPYLFDHITRIDRRSQTCLYSTTALMMRIYYLLMGSATSGHCL